MKQVKFLIPVLCLFLLCGCAEQNGDSTAEVTPTPEVTATPKPTEKTENNSDTWLAYEDYNSVVKYKFKSSPIFDGSKVELNTSKPKEEQVLDACKKAFDEVKQNLDKIDRLYIHFEYLENGMNLGEVLTSIDFDAILDDKDIVDEWKSLVGEAELVMNPEYVYGDEEKYSGVGAKTVFCADISGEVKELFENNGNYYCSSPLPVTKLKFATEEKTAAYRELCDKIYNLAVEKYNKALAEPGNYPYLTD